MAFALSCWLLLHIVALFGACCTRFSSPSAAVSVKAASLLPIETVGRFLVPDMGGLRSFAFGSFAGIGLSGGVLY